MKKVCSQGDLNLNVNNGVQIWLSIEPLPKEANLGNEPKMKNSTHSFGWEDVDGLWCQSEPPRGKGSLLNHLVKGHQINGSILL